MQTVMDSNRGGFSRKIVNESAGVYRWEIRKDGQLVSSNVSGTQDDARRTVRSTTNYLLGR